MGKPKIIQSLFSTINIPKDSIDILNNFDSIIQEIKPLNSKQLQQLPYNIRELSHQLTDQRSTRRLGYLNDSIQLSSYVRYYTWWNLVRLVRLFSNLPDSYFPNDDDICLDIGSGSLTVIIALWLCKKQLRNKKLTWYCLDVSSASMSFGEDIYLSIVAKTLGTPWKIIRVKGAFGTSIKQKCNFITCANMLNELDQASTMPPEFQTKKYFEHFLSYSTKDASFLLIEPGVPKASRTLSLLRDRFINIRKSINAPCPHQKECVMNGFKAYTGSKNKWCNFAFSTDTAPLKLLKLSSQAKLPKDRATLSFVFASSKLTNNDDNFLIRINSDGFFLPHNKTGFYGCSQLGLVLIQTNKTTPLKNGDLLTIPKNLIDPTKKDKKSNAIVIMIENI